MDLDLRLHDTVALIEDIPPKHFKTGHPLLLRLGQIGTIVMTYDGSAFEVEFADSDSCAYALLPVEAGKLMRLRDVPEYAVT
jgi:hypothetical protein